MQQFDVAAFQPDGSSSIGADTYRRQAGKGTEQFHM